MRLETCLPLRVIRNQSMDKECSQTFLDKLSILLIWYSLHSPTRKPRSAVVSMQLRSRQGSAD